MPDVEASEAELNSRKNDPESRESEAELNSRKNDPESWEMAASDKYEREFHVKQKMYFKKHSSFVKARFFSAEIRTF